LEPASAPGSSDLHGRSDPTIKPAQSRQEAPPASSQSTIRPPQELQLEIGRMKAVYKLLTGSVGEPLPDMPKINFGKSGDSL